MLLYKSPHSTYVHVNNCLCICLFVYIPTYFTVLQVACPLYTGNIWIFLLTNGMAAILHHFLFYQQYIRLLYGAINQTGYYYKPILCHCIMCMWGFIGLNIYKNKKH